MVILVGCRAAPEEHLATEAWFVEVAAESGLGFRHFLGTSGEFYFPETAAGGVALLDYDGDGDLDVFLPQGEMLEATRRASESPFPPDPRSWPGDRLYRNDAGPDGARFVDVSAAAGVDGRGYSMGATAADHDLDGDVDLYVTRFGSNSHYRNDGNGRFTDVTAAMGTDDLRWSAGASFADYDGDRDLDLLVVNYVDFTVAGARSCTGPAGQRDYCGPTTYEPMPDRLLRNDGEVFTDVTEQAGLHAAFGSGLGVVAHDFDGDGRTDFFVANDQRANQHWRNLGDGTFEDLGLLSGTALNDDGAAEASMGVALGDFDRDGDEDLFVTHLEEETNTLYVNRGGGAFSDLTAELGLAAPSRAFTGFGTGWFDYDHDGRLDLFVANGAVKVIDGQRATSPFPFHQKNQLLRNLDDGRFEDVGGRAGQAFELSEVSRGAALGDVDNDGDVDVLVANINGPVRLLRNELPAGGNWLQLSALSGVGGAIAIGARVGVTAGEGLVLWRTVRTDGSYLSSHDPRAHFGLAQVAGVALEIQWPEKDRTRWREVPANRSLIAYGRCR